MAAFFEARLGLRDQSPYLVGAHTGTPSRRTFIRKGVNLV